MKPITKTQKQWLWFAGLWCVGFFAVAMLAYSVRWVVRLW
jgi:hypothetical protein